MTILHLKQPPHFSPRMEVVACFITCNERILFLKRQLLKSEGNTWCVPGGKRGKDETLLFAMQREIYEETGLNIAEQNIQYCQTTYAHYPNFEFNYHLFRSNIVEEPMVQINIEEHSEFCWMTLNEAYLLPLTPGVDEALQLLYS